MVYELRQDPLYQDARLAPSWRDWKQQSDVQPGQLSRQDQASNLAGVS